jgi:hypothetical protein
MSQLTGIGPGDADELGNIKDVMLFDLSFSGAGLQFERLPIGARAE